MVAIGALFGRFRRLIHDLSRDLGKPVEFVTGGEDTELDKTVIERLPTACPPDPQRHRPRHRGTRAPGRRRQGRDRAYHADRRACRRPGAGERARRRRRARRGTHPRQGRGEGPVAPGAVLTDQQIYHSCSRRASRPRRRSRRCRGAGSAWTWSRRRSRACAARSTSRPSRGAARRSPCACR